MRLTADAVCLELDTDGAADDAVIGADEVVVDLGENVGGHGEADALRAHGLGVDGGVHADHLAGEVDQGAARVAGIDGGVGLDEALELLGEAGGVTIVGEPAVLGGDDAGRDGLREAEGAADGEHPVAHLRAVGVAEFDGGEGGLGVDLDDGDIGFDVDANDGGGVALHAGEAVFGLAGELDVDLVGLVDDMVVGDDVAARVDDEA